MDQQNTMMGAMPFQTPMQNQGNNPVGPDVAQMPGVNAAQTGSIGGSQQSVTPVMPAVATGPQIASSSPELSAPERKQKMTKGTLIETIVLVVVCLIAAAGIICAVVFFLKWDESETNIQGQIDMAVAEAKDEQKTMDEVNFAEREKLPNTEFVGPSDYGSLSFMYPKTWSVYVAKDASNGGDFEAYLNPVQVEPVSNTTINALRVVIYDRPIDQVRTQYDASVKNGKLTSEVYQVGDVTGTLYTGQITTYISGIMLMIKINDKTAIIQTDSQNFKSDFEALIATIRIS